MNSNNFSFIIGYFLLDYKCEIRILEIFRNILETFEERTGRESINCVDTPTIIFQNVKFQYSKERELLKNISFQMSPGEKIGIIGENGSGKSTIIELLLRFYEPNDGAILCNDKNIHDLNLSEYRDLFSVVSQKPFLFIGTIIENIDLTGNAEQNKLKDTLVQSKVAEY